jgi:hypothetical protein
MSRIHKMNEITEFMTDILNEMECFGISNFRGRPVVLTKQVDTV